jgi:hypothetical protein
MINCLTGAIIVRHIIPNIYLNKPRIDPPQGPPPVCGFMKVQAGLKRWPASWEGWPQETDSAGDTRLRPVWAFKPSTEMTSYLWPTWTVNVLAPLKTTRYELAYGAARGFCWLLTRT